MSAPTGHINTKGIITSGLLIAALLLSGTSHAANTKLEQIRSQIKSLEQDLDKSKDKQRSAQQKLRNIEVNIGQVSTQIRKNSQQQRKLNQQLKKLRQRQQQLQGNLAKHHDILKQHVNARFRQGEQGYLKIIINQQDPSTMGRNLMFYQYINQARIGSITAIETDITELTNVEQETKARQQELDQVARELSSQKQTLDRDKKQRGQLLASINKKIRSQEQQLQELVENARRLEKLVNKIHREQQQQPPVQRSKPTNFAKLRGKLPWPVKGRLAARFGKPRNLGKLTWDGVLIKAPEGADVKAIADGKVVFSDWLRGYGLLVILDHGSGYLTLYGQNQSLLRHVGDEVRQGEIIANVGDSGGNKQAGLYFEVRAKGKPSNPVRWCKGSKPG